MSSGGSNGSNIYQYQNSPQADAGAIQGTQQLQNSGTQLQGFYNNAVSGLQNLTQGTNYSAQTGVNAGNQIMGAANGANLPGYANQALATGFNANNGLYNQELGQLTDQTNSALAQRGISASPYGAGVLGNVLGQFNNQWNNQLLQNQGVAANTANSLLGSYGNNLAQGSQVAQNAANNPLGALQSLIQSGNLSSAQTQAAVNDYLSYLSGGTQAAQAKDQVANQQEQINNQGLAGLGQLGGTVLGLGTGGGNTVGGSLFTSLGSFL